MAVRDPWIDLLDELTNSPLPPRWHRCRETYSHSPSWLTFPHLSYTISYCTCGGTRVNGGGRWVNRNSRRKQQ